MKKIHINLTDELHTLLKDRAAANRRTMQDEVVQMLERGLSVIEIPVIGKIKDGTVEFEEYVKNFPNTIDPRD